MAHLLEKLEHGFEKAEEKLKDFVSGEKHSHTHMDSPCSDSHPAEHAGNRYSSFAPQSSGHAKWYVDGASYFWAVSEALENAQETVYILDWWLSPELYLRRPPAANEQYRLDAMLKACAERGVQVNVIVYKEVPQALTLNSQHTKHALEALHPNIRVFRHPDHVASGSDIAADIENGFKNFSLNTFNLATLPHDAIKALYGTADDSVLFWAHHEKLCIVDSKIAFMGGLDMCFGRWDTNSHPIADVHANMDEILYPGQDYNNARIYDFEDVDKWENNKLDRKESSRMGWSDISISLSGQIVNSLVVHFIDRWNYIFNGKYSTKNPGEYRKLDASVSHAPHSEVFEGRREHFGGLHRHFTQRMNRMLGLVGHSTEETQSAHGAHVQLTRSCCPWSSGHPTEHSIANAYIEAITNAQHFVYIENQFFITATSDKQLPVANKIGAAIVNRIVRAHRESENFQVIVLIPSVPGFAGDLKSDGALGTRAIMEYQYNSINRGGYSIIESLQQQGVSDPHQYINFYNLRNYDRINVSSAIGRAERETGISYESARREFDNQYERGDDYQPNDDNYDPNQANQYSRFQRAAERQGDTTWDTVSSCYMAAGKDLASLPWNGPPEAEMDAYVSEELYIHTKVLIADDRLVICGSANLNDRSQLGSHDSEIAVVIEDPTPVDSLMAGEPFTASRFAASLRRQLFRKHLGLLADQPPTKPDDAVGAANWTPVDSAGGSSNEYDWGSEADALVRDPLDPRFRQLWRDTARTNTEVFSRAFHTVPNDRVRTWEQYEEFFEKRFVLPGVKPEEREKALKEEGKVLYGHVVREEFPEGIEELKMQLARVRGNLVEMPLQFLIDVKDLAKEGLSLNELTEQLYT